MPFDDSFTDIYKLGIKPACETAGAYCERVDEQIFSESILERIYNQIGKADLIVSDMSGRNPNVFYETGYAHALNKRVILLTQNADDIPFDLKHFAHIVYAGKIVDLRDELERRVSWYLEQPSKTVELVEEIIEYYAEGQNIVEGTELKISLQNTYYNRRGPQEFKLYLSFHNPTQRIIDVSSLSFSIIIPEGTSFETNKVITHLPDNRLMYPSTRLGELFPSAWENRKFQVIFDHG